MYVWSTIFAPAELSTTIIHQWQYYDDVERKWVERDLISYQITGGREDGYRGYTYKTNVDEGRWRVDAETERGQVLGRMYVRVSYDDEVVELVEYKK